MDKSFHWSLWRLLGLSLLITMTIASIGGYFMLKNVNVISYQYDNILKPVSYMEEVSANYWQAHALMLQMALDKDRDLINKNYERLIEIHDLNAKLIRLYQDTEFIPPSEEALFNNVMDKLHAYQQVHEQALELVLDSVNDKAIAAFNEFNHQNLLPSFREFITAQEGLTDHLLVAASAYNKENAGESRLAFVAILAVILLGLIVQVVAGSYFSAKIMSVLGRVTVFAKEISNNNFDSELDEELLLRKDEFGSMSRALDLMGLKLSKSMERLCKTAEKLAASNEQAQKANEHKSVFLARMSHEIRTPLNAIIGMTYIAKRAKEQAAVNDCLNKITTSSAHLLGIVNDILDMSKIEAGKFELMEDEFGLEKLLMNVCTVVSVKTDEKEQNLLVSIDSDLSSRFIGDSLRLSQVLTNIINNASKFTPVKGTISLRVSRLERNSLSSRVQFVVEDTGIGLTGEQLGRLFTPFEQADSGTTRQFGGTGLGLTICNRIVGMMDGDIKVESEFGKGSRFIITVKLRNSQQLESTRLDESVDVFSIRALLVDESETAREFFINLFKELNISIAVAENTGKAFQLMRENAFNLVFLDWNTAEDDAAEFVESIKKDYGDQVVVVLVSNSKLTEIEGKATEAGVNRFLPKPFFPSTVINLINEVIGMPDVSAGGVYANEVDLGGKSMLLVEDIEINREIVFAYLEGTGVRIDIAENGAEAVEKYMGAKGKYDVVLMDVHMPVMDGYTASRRIRQDELNRGWSRVPIIAMTANAFKEDIERCVEAGMDDHLSKPMGADELVSLLQKYMLDM